MASQVEYSQSAGVGADTSVGALLPASAYDPGYAGMPSNEDMFGWIETMWQFGDRDRDAPRDVGLGTDAVDLDRVLD